MATLAFEPTLARLRAISDENPGLGKAVRFYQRLIPALNDLGKTIPALVVDPDVVRSKMAVGIPLLVGEPYDFDIDQVQHIFKTVCSIAPGADSQARRILHAVAQGDLDPVSLLSPDLNSQAELVESVASRLGLDSPLLGLVAQNTLKIFLYAWRSAVENQVKLDEWRRCICPFCGGKAGLAEIRGVESARYLRCLHCGGGWPFSNLRCSFCGNENHRMLGVILVGGFTSKPYLHTCDCCHRYIKTVVSFEPISSSGLLVEDLATLSLDRLAEELGYVA